MTALLVANDGGHLMQLHTLAPQLDISPHRVWVTVPTPQTESLLAGEVVHWVSPAPTRDKTAVLRNARLASSVFNHHRFTRVVSTGSSLALSVLPQSRARGIPTCYIESATRASGPSVSGRILAKIPGMGLYTQHQPWARSPWKYLGSVFDRFEVCSETAEPKLRSVVVSLGTSEKYGFRRMVERLCKVIPSDANVLWQTGSTDTSGLGIDARARVPNAELAAAMREADVVVCHAGTGIALTSLENGQLPVLIPRRPEFGEHVDDHQLQIAGDLARKGLAHVRECDALDTDDLHHAARLSVRAKTDMPQLRW